MASGTASRLARLASLSFVLQSGAALATVMPPPPDYVPKSITVANLTPPSKGTVCVVGTSMQSATAPAYYLKGNGKTVDGKPQWVWTRPTSSTRVTALALGASGASILSTPPSVTTPYVNAGNIRFFFVAAPSSPQSCSKIFYTFKDSAGDLIEAHVPYPLGLLEVSSYPVMVNNVTAFKAMTIDTSNVDSFQLPMQLSFTGISSKAGGSQAAIGNPVAVPTMTRRNLITGPTGTGCSSPFATWLKGRGPDAFSDLVQRSAVCDPSTPNPVYPFAMILSPTDYLTAECLDTPAPSPQGCRPSGKLLHGPTSALATYYDQELQAFFGHAQGLIVMGDAIGTIKEQPWKVSSVKGDCPVYLRPDGASLDFVPDGTASQVKSAPAKITLCNPLGQVVYLDAPPTKYMQSGHVASVDITAQQYAMVKNKTGWNFGQPETGWIATVQKFVPNPDGSYRVLLNVLGAPPAQVTAPQPICMLKTCPMASNSYALWAFTNIKYTQSTNPFETASQMVFGNDGAFSSWLYYQNSNQMTVTLSIERNIAWAFAHGIANCNNLTMATPDKAPPYCKTVRKLDATAYATGVYGASDAYWSNEANWYPAGGPQNYYAQYLHTAQLDAAGQIAAKPDCAGCRNIFAPAALPISGSAQSNQGVTMGMAYGFGYDENPDYLSSKPRPPAQVPSKLDPIPPQFGQAVGVTVTIGEAE